jgi:hypothetical protein
MRKLKVPIIVPAILVLAAPVWGEVKMEKVQYFNQPNCYRLTNGTVELIVTTDIGPRIIRYGFPGGGNILAELPDSSVKTAFGEWKAYGGHRLWHAPEAMPRTYSPDSSPIDFKIEGTDTIHLTQPVEEKTGIQKEIIVTMDADGSGVTIKHRLTNKGVWAIDLAPWALTIMRGGGVTVIPQEPYISHDDFLLPARPLVLWHYTDLADPRWTIGRKYLQLKTVEAGTEPQKAGVANKQGWCAYSLNKTLFVKRFPYKDGSNYPDQGCNNEVYTAGSFMEVETLGPMNHLEPGQSAEHVERWYLYKGIDIGATEASLDAAISPIVAETAKTKP